MFSSCTIMENKHDETLRRLKRLRTLPAEISSKIQEKNELLQGYYKSSMFAKFPKSKQNGNATEEKNITIISEISELEEEITALSKERSKLVQMINEIEDPVERMVARLYYVNNKTFKEIACDINLSIRQLQRAKTKAVEKIQNMLY